MQEQQLPPHFLSSFSKKHIYSLFRDSMQSNIVLLGSHLFDASSERASVQSGSSVLLRSLKSSLYRQLRSPGGGGGVDTSRGPPRSEESSGGSTQPGGVHLLPGKLSTQRWSLLDGTLRISPDAFKLVLEIAGWNFYRQRHGFRREWREDNKPGMTCWQELENDTPVRESEGADSPCRSVKSLRTETSERLSGRREAADSSPRGPMSQLSTRADQ